jgi:hypothetical protein
MRLRSCVHLALIAMAATSLAACDTLNDVFTWNRDRPKIEGERVSIVATDQDLVADPDLASVPVTLPPAVVNRTGRSRAIRQPIRWSICRRRAR